MEKGFWAQLKKPIIGCSPMDGVTDAPFRFIMARYGKPDITITEFTSAEGIAAGAEKLLLDFWYSKEERPVVAQIFGASPEAFAKAAAVAAAMGFDGLDINMGCPANNVARHGGGAALIRTPDLAKKLILAARQALEEWVHGKTLGQFGVPENIIAAVERFCVAHGVSDERRMIPISVKTRIGYDAVVIDEWIAHLLEVEPIAISVHGRTLKQLYTGKADWDAIARAVLKAKGSGTLVLGNGDVASIDDALNKVAAYGVDGVLIGRQALGNPWLFQNVTPTIEEKLSVAKEHASYFENVFHGTGKFFITMRKHLAWYAHGFDGAAALRERLMRAGNAQECSEIINEFLMRARENGSMV